MHNRLATQSSPYLLQHCQQPVDWFSWADKATVPIYYENRTAKIKLNEKLLKEIDGEYDKLAGGGIVPGEAGDEVLAGGFFLPGVFHQVQDFGHGGLLARQFLYLPQANRRCRGRPIPHGPSAPALVHTALCGKFHAPYHAGKLPQAFP